MPTAPLITPFAAWQLSPGVFMARVLGLAGTAITQATISAITYAVGTVDSDGVYTAVIPPASLTVADVVSDTLDTSEPWTKDAIGTNFRHTHPNTSFPDPAARSRVEYRFTPTTGSQYAFSIVFEGKVNEVFSL